MNHSLTNWPLPGVDSFQFTDWKWLSMAAQWSCRCGSQGVSLRKPPAVFLAQPKIGHMVFQVKEGIASFFSNCSELSHRLRIQEMRMDKWMDR